MRPRDSTPLTVLVVRAHPEPRSFSNALADTATRVLAEAGHTVLESDLYAMGFNPVITPEDTTSEATDSSYFNPAREQEEAWAHARQADDVVLEQGKIAAADVILFHFPVWWFSAPAILKGWFDRVLSRGFAYSRGQKYGTGHFRGKRAMLCLTTGTAASLYEPNGIDGDLHHVLWPIHNGTLAYTGFTVFEPFVAWMPGRVSDDERAAYLEEYANKLRNLDAQATLFFHPWEDYDDNEQLKAGVEARSGVQWNPAAGQTRAQVARERHLKALGSTGDDVFPLSC
jgi:NAD(P)H dehydrogenase (quinone)